MFIYGGRNKKKDLKDLFLFDLGQHIYYPIEITFGSFPDTFVSHQSILMNNRIYVVGYHTENNTMLYSYNPITNCWEKHGYTSKFKCDCATLFATGNALISFGGDLGNKFWRIHVGHTTSNYLTGKWGAREKNLVQLGKDLNGLYKKQDFCDLNFKTKDGAIKVHHLWVKIRWAQFAKHKSKIIKLIRQYSTKVMNTFFQYLYSDTFKRPKKIKIEELDYIFELISFSNQVGIERLAGLVIKWLREKMRLDVVFEVLQIAQKYQCNKIVNFCLGFLFFHRHSIIENKSQAIQKIKDHQLHVRIKRILREIFSPYVRYTLDDISEDQEIPNSSFKKDILRLMSDKSNSDVICQMGGDNNFRLHSFILVARSDFLYHTLKELINNQTKNNDESTLGNKMGSNTDSDSDSDSDTDSDSDSDLGLELNSKISLKKKSKIDPKKLLILQKKRKFNISKFILEKLNQISKDEINFSGINIQLKKKSHNINNPKREVGNNNNEGEDEHDENSDDSEVDVSDSDDSDGKEENMENEKIKEISLKYFNILMRIIYALDFELDFDSAQLLLDSQSHFGLHFNLVLLECVKVIKKSITKENCLLILEKSIKYDLPLLQDYIIDKIINQFSKSLITETVMQQISPQICKKILLKMAENDK